MTPRQLLTQVLQATLPADVDIIAYSHNIDAPSTSTVMVRFDKANPSPVAGMGARLYEFTLIGIAAKTTAGPADDELDKLLEDVLYAISKADNGITWTEARRGAYGEPDPTNPAFEVTCPVTFIIS